MARGRISSVEPSCCISEDKPQASKGRPEEIRKRPVVREEIRVSKDKRVENRQVSETVRREEARVQSQGDVERSEQPIGSPTDPNTPTRQ